LSPFGVIVAATAAVVVTIVAVVLVAPATVALAAFVVALAVVTTTVLTVDVGLIFDCCVPSPPEEDHHLPPSMPRTSCIVHRTRGTHVDQRENLFSPPPHSAEHEHLRTQLPAQGKTLHCTWMWLGGRLWRRRRAKAAAKTGYSLFLDGE